MIIKNYWIKVKVLSIKYKPRNRILENDLGQIEFIKVEEDG